MTDVVIFSDAVESCLRVIMRAQPDKRDRVFELQAADAIRYAEKAGFDKSAVIDRLYEIGTGFDWQTDDLQRRLAAAVKASQSSPAKPGDRPRSGGVIFTPLEDASGDRPPAFSDDALAQRFVDQHANHLRFTAAWGRWHVFDDTRWVEDNTLKAFDLVRQSCRAASATTDKPKIATTIASAKTVSSVERLAKAFREMAATADQWDADTWALNTPDGVYDLRTGERHPHQAVDYMTKITGVAPDPDCATPIWLRFLDRTAGGDGELIAFLRRMSGYALTGSVSAHALFFLYGTGANGKSTFLNALMGCLGDYHQTSAIETFTATAGDRHPTDLAGLRGARLVTATETEEGRRWAESKIKSLTGGDKIAARFMRQDFFSYTPTFKLIIAGNHKPGLRSVDEAIRRRFHLVPFTTTIPPAERDETLSEQLKAEWPGILAWAIAGCLEWQQCGLAPPEAVQSATAAYLESEDALASWIEEAGDRDPETWESSAVLFRSWKTWADRAGEHAGSLKKFSQRIEDRGEAIGMRKARDSAGRRGFYGLRVTRPDLASGGAEESTQ